MNMCVETRGWSQVRNAVRSVLVGGSAWIADALRTAVVGFARAR